MKRILSLILALTMLISLVPATFAEGEAAQEMSGITVTYGMVSGPGYTYANKTDMTVVGFGDTNGFWEFYSKATTAEFSVANSYSLFYNCKVNNWVAVKIYVPQKGKYDVSLDYGWMKAGNNGAQQGGMWILPLVNEATGAEYTKDEIAAALTLETAKTTNLDFRNDDATGNTKVTTEAGNYYFPEAGEYLVVYKALKDYNNSATDLDTYARMYIGAVTLNGGTGVAPMALTSEVDKPAVAPDGGTAKMTVTAIMSDGTYEDYTDKVTYSVDGTATVAKDGTITGGAEGEAKVTAALEAEGRTLTTSQTVKVAKDGIRVFYDVAGDSFELYDGASIKFLTGLTYNKTNDFYAFYDTNVSINENTTYADIKSSIATNGSAAKETYHLLATTNRVIALEVNIPKAGTYAMEMYHGKGPKGQDVSVYLSTAKAFEDNGFPNTTSSNKVEQIKASLGKYLDTYSCYEKTANWAITEEPSTIKGIEIDEPGKYVLSFFSHGGWGSVGSFYLTSGTGEIIPMKEDINIDSGYAEVEIVMSDNSLMDLSGAAIEFSSSNPEVVSVDKKTGEVEIFANGSTVLTANVVHNGEAFTVTVEKNITELPETTPCAGVVQTYDFLEIKPDWKPFTNMGTENEQTNNSNVSSDSDVHDIKYKYTDGNWEWFGAGPNNLLTKNARSYQSYLRIYPGAGRWYGITINVPDPGKYAVFFEYSTRNSSAGDADVYIVPKPASGNPKDADGLLTKQNYVGYVNFLDKSLAQTKTAQFKNIEFDKEGEYVLIFNQGSTASYFYLRKLTLDGINNLKVVNFSAEKTELYYNESTQTSVTARLLDGTKLQDTDYTVTYASSRPDIAAVDENGIITAKGHGDAIITATVTSGDSTITQELTVTAIDNTEILKKEIELDDVIYVGEKTKVSLKFYMESGNEIVFPAEDVTYSCDESGAITFDEPGFAHAVSEKKNVKVTASVLFNGAEVTAEKKLDVAVDDGKTASTYYTDEKLANARENAKTYSWAKSLAKTATGEADKYIDRVDDIYDMIPSEGIPRSTWTSVPKAPYPHACRYCGEGMELKGSEFTTDVLNRPWKIQCHYCKRLFPSNDFEGFYKLGLDREGLFDRVRALEAHRAMLLEMGKKLPDAGITDERRKWINEGQDLTQAERDHYGFGVEGGYLINKLYPELADSENVPETLNFGAGLRPGEDWKTWGVDDGWGYVPLTEDGVTPYYFTSTGSDGKVEKYLEKHIYVAQIHINIYETFIAVLGSLRDAYLYTGDIKYGRAGAIILDRIADVYHTYDNYMHNDGGYAGDMQPARAFYTTDDGSTGTGIIQGNNTSTHWAQELAKCADAFFPALTDSQVINYLSEKAKVYGYDTLPDDVVYNFHEYTDSAGVKQDCEGNCREYEHEMRRNDKASSRDIWRNWENGIIRKNHWGARYARLKGNYGQRQATAVINAVVQAREPETTEMIEWCYQPMEPETPFLVGGGGVTSQLIDVVDRDGMGHEASPNYNRTQIEGLGDMADYLADYKGRKQYNLYENPKFVQMLIAYCRALMPQGHPNIGDNTNTVQRNYYAGDVEIWKKAFKNLKDTEFGKQIAQYLWTRNGRTTEGLHYDIFTEDPESFEDDVAALVDENDSMKSELMAGYGLAILRDGGIYESASASTETDNRRDFWISAGVNYGHGHPDALNLNIDAFGLDLGADLGYPEMAGMQANRLQWVSQGVSHNTVLVNEKSCNLRDENNAYIRGFPRHFDDSNMVKLMDIDASHKYDETENYRRTLVMVKVNDDVSYGVDFFRITGGTNHTYIYHSQSSKLNEVSGLDIGEPDMIQVDKEGTMDWATYAGKDAAYVQNPDGSRRKALPGEEVDFETVFPVTYGEDPWTVSAWVYDTMFPQGYTWLRNVRRAQSPQKNFTVDFEITDYQKAVTNNKDLHLRLTQINDFVPTGVAFAGGHALRRTGSAVNVGYVDKLDPSRAKMLEYIYIERESESGEELDSLFTTVYEPYRGTSNLGAMEEVAVTVTDGTEQSGDVVRAVKVAHADGKRFDYVVYATNNDVTYNVGGLFDFRGFVGVYSVDESNNVIYRYIHDGSLIGDNVIDEKERTVGTVTGEVKDFEHAFAFENYIDVSVNEQVDASELENKYIYVNNDGVQNAAYKIEGVTELENGNVRLDIGAMTLIRGHKDVGDPDLGYVYNIDLEQTFAIPLTYYEDYTPEFTSDVSSVSTSAGSTIKVQVTAESKLPDNPITYIGTTLPRGASVNAETGVFTWKPDSSQIGENHVAITARDSDGRENTVHFTVTVYGSTTGGSSSNQTNESDKTETPETGTTDTPAGGGGGGGGGGGAAPTDTPSVGDADSSLGEEALDDDKTDASTQPDVGFGGSDEPKFTDLGNHAWATDAINALAADGIIKGTSASTFSPAANITRADFAILLVRAFDLASDNAENFADVSASDYFASELAIARNVGIVGGIGDNKFAPRNSITRQDMMVIVYRALEASLASLFGRGVTAGDGEGQDGTNSDVEGISPSQSLTATALPGGEPSKAEQYPDFNTVAPYARDAVSSLISAGLVNGKNGLIAPLDYTTRAEIAVLLSRVLGYIK